MTGLPVSPRLVLGMLVAAMALTLVRLLRGPSTPDRVVALELVSTLSVGMIAVYTIDTNEPQLLGPATVLALLAFLGTVAFARYLEKKARS